MAIKINDHHASRAGWSIQGGRTYTSIVRVESDDPIGGKAAIDACNLPYGMAYRYPLGGTAWETDPSAYMQSVEAADASDGLGTVWDVTISYGPFNAANDARGPVDEQGFRQPFLAPPTLRSYGEQEEFALTRDREGTKILNSAGDPFADPLAVAVPVLTFEVTRLERFFVPTLVATIQGRINHAEWLGWPAGSVLCRSISGSRVWNTDVDGWAWEVVYLFAVKRPIEVSSKLVYPGWSVQVLDAGFRELVSGERRQILVDGMPATMPVPLDGSGSPLDPADEPVYKTFQIFPLADFGDLNFPADLFTAGTPEI